MHPTAACIRRGPARGFTLVEAMISLFVFGLVTVIFASSLIVGKSASTMNGQYAQAISLGQHKIDQLRVMGYGKLTYIELQDADRVDATPTTQPYSFVGVDQVATCLPNPTAQLWIADAAGSYDSTRVKLVTVIITWKASPRRTTNSTLTLRAYIAKD
jgi:type II secretory pathway pseudopilin PulG